MCEECGKVCKSKGGLKLHQKKHEFESVMIDESKIKVYVEKTCNIILNDKLYLDNILTDIKVIKSDCSETDLKNLCHTFNGIKAKSKEQFLSKSYQVVLLKFDTFFGTEISDESKKIFLMKFINLYMTEMLKSDIDEEIHIKNLTDREIAGLQYLGGYVLFNLSKKYRNSKKFKSEFIQQTLAIIHACREEHENKNYRLVAAVNRGGLWFITEDIQKIFMITERYFCVNTSSKYLTKIEIDNFVIKLANHYHIQELFGNIVKCIDMEIEESIQESTLTEIITYYLRVRAFSYAKSKLQVINFEKRSKFKSLRQEIVRSTNDG